MSRPVILTVDDDAAVSRAIARDLRRQYGERYRIVRAESGPDALEALGELVTRGEQPAVLLADHRMPGMNGVEFLERAMDIAPMAKRALLTAYADTDAAIAAINTVDLDRYLLKPWDPPEDQLYPVLDELLDDFAATHRPAFDGVRVVGHRWSLPSNDVKEFLARNGVPFEWLEVDSEPAQRLLGAAQVGDAELPVVVVPGGEVLRTPTTRELATRIGLSTTAERPFYDLVVVGGGPAGLGAAVYGASEGLRTLLVERSATGGQAGQSSRIENYLGFPRGVSGAELARRASDQARRLDVEILSANEVTRIAHCGAAHVLALADGSDVAAQACIIATGVSYRRLPAAGAARLSGRGIYYGAATHEAINCRDDHVYIVGGANSAGQAAVHFSRYADRVTMLVRGDSLQRSMSQYLIDQIGRVGNIDVRTCTEVAGTDGDGHLETLTLRDSRTGAEETVPAGWLFVFIGASPTTGWLGDGIARDTRGFVLTGPDLLRDGRPPVGWQPEREPYYLETSKPGIFAAGDVRHKSVKRVASAVGEGAMAVTLVHRYLEGSQ
ncbi:MAG TPA: FAD-dependent oxidoreductase [Euzebyales bacterium]|nr:FAD-dependent oxidoreductase [Euzebyales bacterium]